MVSFPLLYLNHIIVYIRSSCVAMSWDWLDGQANRTRLFIKLSSQFHDESWSYVNSCDADFRFYFEVVFDIFVLNFEFKVLKLVFKSWWCLLMDWELFIFGLWLLLYWLNEYRWIWISEKLKGIGDVVSHISNFFPLILMARCLTGQVSNECK